MQSILVACESSGTVRDAFAAMGWDAWSCDLLPASGQHIQGDAIEAGLSRRWDMIIAHPPCTHLSVSGARYWAAKRLDGRQQEAEAFALALWGLPCERIALENPIGRLSTVIGKPSQIIQPWQFGHPESKATCLWLRGLPILLPTRICTPPRRNSAGLARWDNQTDSGQNKLPPSADRWQIRSKTYTGIADAMAKQWTRPATGGKEE